MGKASVVLFVLFFSTHLHEEVEPEHVSVQGAAVDLAGDVPWRKKLKEWPPNLPKKRPNPRHTSIRPRTRPRCRTRCRGPRRWSPSGTPRWSRSPSRRGCPAKENHFPMCVFKKNNFHVVLKGIVTFLFAWKFPSTVCVFPIEFCFYNMNSCSPFRLWIFFLSIYSTLVGKV